MTTQLFIYNEALGHLGERQLARQVVQSAVLERE